MYLTALCCGKSLVVRSAKQMTRIAKLNADSLAVCHLIVYQIQSDPSDSWRCDRVPPVSFAAW